MRIILYLRSDTKKYALAAKCEGAEEHLIYALDFSNPQIYFPLKMSGECVRE
jgi:hypothetical protein